MSRSPTLRLEADSAVGSTPSTVQGWRPNSATNQPSSAASQGAGIMTTANLSDQRGKRIPRNEARQKK